MACHCVTPEVRRRALQVRRPSSVAQRPESEYPLSGFERAGFEPAAFEPSVLAHVGGHPGRASGGAVMLRAVASGRSTSSWRQRHGGTGMGPPAWTHDMAMSSHEQAFR
jgi:hypothetical protein